MTKLHVLWTTLLLLCSSLSLASSTGGGAVKKYCTVVNGNVITTFTNIPPAPGTVTVACPPADINPQNYGGKPTSQRQIPGKTNHGSQNSQNDDWDAARVASENNGNSNNGNSNNNGSSDNHWNSNRVNNNYTPPPPRISKEEEEKCKAYFEGIKAPKNDIKRLCDEEKFVDPLMTSDFDKCKAQIATISKSIYSSMLCYTILKETQQSLSQDSLACLRESLESVNEHFPYQEIVIPFMTNSWGKNKTEYMVSDCLKLNQKKAEAGKPAIQNQYQFHKFILRPESTSGKSKREQGDRELLLGGLSGVWYDAKTNKYFAVSDDQFVPFMTDFTWDAANPQSIPALGHSVTIQKPSNDSKLAASYDYEDIVRLSNGNFLVSSEVGGEEAAEKSSGGILSFFFGGDKDKKEEKSKFFLLYEIDISGKIVRGIPVAEDILPKQVTTKVTYDCTPYTYNNNNDNYNGGWGKNNNGDKNNNDGFRLDGGNTTATTTSSTTTTTVKKKYCEREETRVTQGFTHNKGLEALSYLESTQEIFYGTEAPLLQDERKEKKDFVRIYRQTIGNEAATQKYVKYPLTSEFGNGMPALLALNENEILVLERGFDDYKKETHIKIFKIDWRQKDADGYVAKKLVVTMNDIRDQMPAGFRRIDNLEGMARGPETATHLTIILVADNNFRDSQLTQFVAVQIPKELLR